MENSSDNYGHEASAMQEEALQAIKTAAEDIKAEISKMIIGQTKAIDLILAGILTGGHLLLEGVPGVAKTLLARMLAQTLDTQFSRIQFTPDLMPTDVTGTTILNMQSSQLSFNKGPIFSNIVLIDEINRAPAKTQSALFEVMAERQVTYDGTTYPMEEPFLVIATQNPIEQEGTYRLPEAQLDRFLFKIEMSYPSLEEEVAMLTLFGSDFRQRTAQSVRAIVTAEQIADFKKTVEKVFIQEELIRYIAQITEGTRKNKDLFLGASPRASLSILQSSKAMAALEGRSFVTPDDIRRVTFPVLNHRIILSPEKEMEGQTIKATIDNLVSMVAVPR